MLEKIKINKIKTNPKNPRVIKDYKFHKLVNSIKQFPQMLKIRPIIIDENNIILGGNMRYKACIEAGLNEIYIYKENHLTEKQKQEFIVKDNVNFGEWDWAMLGNEWDSTEMKQVKKPLDLLLHLKQKKQEKNMLKKIICNFL